MPKKVRSAKGVIIDFDLMTLKQQLGSKPKPLNVEARRDFIDERLRRRSRKVQKKLLETQTKRRNSRADETVKVENKEKIHSSPQREKITPTSSVATESQNTNTKRKIRKKRVDNDRTE